MTSTYLTEIARLPFTAQLLAKFIKRKGALPSNALEVYTDLRTNLDNSSLLNLEETAWELFKVNQTELLPDPKLPKEFCDAAVEAGVLTRRARDGKEFFRFVHERIHRLFVAYYLDRQDELPLVDWYGKAGSGLGRGYWTDVLEFWGQIKGQHAAEGGEVEREAYRGFIRKVAEFSQSIFAQRLYVQYDRLSRVFPALYEPEFVRWAALTLAKAEE